MIKQQVEAYTRALKLAPGQQDVQAVSSLADHIGTAAFFAPQGS